MQFFAHYSANRSRHSFRTHSHSGFLSFKSLCRIPCHSLGGLAFAFALFHLGSNQRPLLFFGELFDSLISTPFAHYSSRTEHSEAFPGCAIVGAPRVRSLGISPRVRFPVKPLGRTRSLSLRQLTRKRFGTKRIIRLLPALPIIYKFSQCHKTSNSDKCVNNHN